VIKKSRYKTASATKNWLSLFKIHVPRTRHVSELKNQRAAKIGRNRYNKSCGIEEPFAKPKKMTSIAGGRIITTYVTRFIAPKQPNI
jgi:hypothetical protein